MRPAGTTPRLPLRVHLLVAAVVVLGVGAVAGLVGRTWPRGFGSVELLVICLVGLVIVNSFRVEFSYKGQGETVSLDELFFVVLAMSSTPMALALALVVANVYGSIRFRLPLVKVVFNAGSCALSVAAGLAVMTSIAGELPIGSSGTAMGAAVVGALTMHVVQTLAVRAVVAAADALPWTLVMLRIQSIDIILLSCSVSVGLLAGQVSLEAPARMLVVLPLLVAVLFVLHGHADLVRERTQLDLLLNTAVNASRTTSVQGISDLLAEAARRLLHTMSAAVRPTPPGPDEIGARIEAGSTPTWLVAAGEPTKQTVGLLEGVAAIGTGAIGTALLLETVQRQELYDPLTGLPNRVLLQDRVEQAIRRGSSSHVALFHLDVDRFKRINDSLGRAAGDQALREVAERLVSILRPGETAARVSGDEFAVVAAVRSVDEAFALAERIRATLIVPLSGVNAGVVVTASTGVALWPDDGRDFASLLHTADHAMQQAKESGRDTVRRIASSRPTRDDLGLEGDLRRAMTNGQLWVAYQPQLDLRTLQVVGTEALVRWSHPDRGLLRPDQFLPLAEQAGLLGAIDLLVLELACRQTATWRRTIAPELRVAVNLSGSPLRSEALHEQVVATLVSVGLPPEALEIEVTENVVGAEHEATIGTLSSLRNLGITVAIDDFGTGYSSLSRLQSLPVDVLKIDQSFVREITDATVGVPLVTSTIGMAHGLGLQVVAEGIETPEQLRFLTAAGCESAQGYLLGRPVAAEGIEELLRRAPAAQSDVSAASTQLLNP